MKLNCFRNNFTSDLEPSIILDKLIKDINKRDALKHGVSSYRIKFIKSTDEKTTFWLIPTPYLITQNVYIHGTIYPKSKNTKIIFKYFPSLWFNIILSLVVVFSFAGVIYKSLLSSWTLPLTAIMIIICIFGHAIFIRVTNKNINTILKIAHAY
jgi:hypothetical protein